MAFKKRRKSTRYRGSHTHARGFKKKARGSGHRGGVGMAGTGKRGDAKKTLVLNLYGNDYFGKDKALRRGNHPAKLQVIDIQQISDNLNSLMDKTNQVNLQGYKILGEGDIKAKVKILASAASQSAMEKVKKAGGEIILPVKKEKEEKKEDKAEKPTNKEKKEDEVENKEKAEKK